MASLFKQRKSRIFNLRLTISEILLSVRYFFNSFIFILDLVDFRKIVFFYNDICTFFADNCINVTIVIIAYGERMAQCSIVFMIENITVAMITDNFFTKPCNDFSIYGNVASFWREGFEKLLASKFI